MTRLEWLLEGDPVVAYQVKKDLLNASEEDLKKIQKQMLKEGWINTYLSKQNPDGHWGEKFYCPKWISTHYTLLDLCRFNAPVTEGINKAIDLILTYEIADDGGVSPSPKHIPSDLCINGMFLNYACYFGVNEERIKGIIDYIIKQEMADGGFNCRLNRSGAKHSSVHTTLCMLEGIERYRQMGYQYKLDKLTRMQRSSEEFLLKHHLYKSDKTGEIIHNNMTVFSIPPGWKYNVLRALDYFRFADRPYDKRMQDGLDLILSKQNKEKLWKVQAKHPGKYHMILEKPRQASRLVTVMAMRVLEKYQK